MLPVNTFRILHVIAPGPIAGAEKSVLASVQALKLAGYSVELAVIRETRNPDCAEEFVQFASLLGVETKLFSTGKRLDLSLAYKLKEFILSEGFNVVHSHDYKALLHLAFFRSDIPALLATYHGATSHTITVQLYEFVERVLFQMTDCIFAVSEGARKTLESRGSFNAPIAIVPNFVPNLKIDGRRTRNPSRDALQLLFLGRLSYEKGLDILLAAVAMIADQPVFLNVVGDGPQRSSLMGMAESLNIAHKVRFFGFQRDVVKYLEDADVLVMPSRTEAMPMALIEASTLGIPVIASAVGGIPEIVTSFENGVLVPPSEPSSLKDAIMTVQKELSAFKCRAEQKASSISERYSATGWVRSAVCEYAKVLQFPTPSDMTE